jgi:uncharacterized protein (TIGR02266 family)
VRKIDAVSSLPRSGRCDLEVEAALVAGNLEFSARTKNIGSGGVFVATHELRPIGDRLAVTFSLPGWETPISVGAEVRWTRGEQTLQQQQQNLDRSVGMGLQFLGVPPEVSDAIHQFLSEQEQRRRQGQAPIK